MTIIEANKPLSDGINALILKKGIKQKIVAERAGYTPQELSDMLNGRRLIKACDIPRIAEALDSKSDDIYEMGRKMQGKENESVKEKKEISL